MYSKFARGDLMKQTIYCDCFYCEHHENGKCLSPVLHLDNINSCKEFTFSEEKLDAYLEARANDPNKPTEYGTYHPRNRSTRIRRK